MWSDAHHGPVHYIGTIQAKGILKRHLLAEGNTKKPQKPARARKRCGIVRLWAIVSDDISQSGDLKYGSIRA